MGYPRSTLVDLAKLRAGGQRPEGSIVVVGGPEAKLWASRNRFFCVDAREIADDMTPFTDLFVILRSDDRELAQKLAMVARMVTVHSQQTYENMLA
jgi:hypothetical protein